MLLIQELFFKLKINFLLRWSWQNKGLLLRASFCFITGLIFLQFDEKNDHDLRLAIRGPQPADSNIVLILIPTHSTSPTLQQGKTLRSGFNMSIPNSQSFPWKQLMHFFEKAPIKAAAFSFSPQPNNSFWKSKFQELKKIILFSSVYTLDRENNTVPHLSTVYLDGDGIVRRFKYSNFDIPHLILGLKKSLNYDNYVPNSFIINYRGNKSNSFKAYTLSEILNPKFDSHLLKDKIVLIGNSKNQYDVFRTPIGTMSRIEVLANIFDNMLNTRWIQRVPKYWSKLFLLALTVLGISIIVYYPQFISFVFFLWVGTAITTLSIWLFDSFYFWTPILTPLSVLLLLYIVFISYQLSIKENLTWRLEQEKKYLFEVEQLKSNFVSLISHDLKTPIAKIQAIVDRLLIQKLNPEIETDLGLLRSESSELHRYIQSILKITRVESKEFKLSKTSQDINKIIKSASQQLTPLAQNKNIQISTDLEPLFLIDIDKMLIFEVILNLIENAIKYSSQDGVVKITSSELDESILITIEDNGPGISKEEQKNVFKKFHRGKEHSMHTKGSGLGLYLVKYFIELHNGEISIESEIGLGTTIILTLPLDD